jgi:predicted DsbA family dithiol-disulfide isomerase
LAAERIAGGALPLVPEWEPALLAERDSPPDRALIEQRAREFGLQPLRWPPAWPVDTRTAMLAATYAKRAGRAVAFSLAAFRQAFAAGRDLRQTDTVLIAAAACELHPKAILKALELRSVADALTQASSRAEAHGVTALPAIVLDGEVLDLEAAAEALRV